MTARPFLETWTESGVKYSNVNINNYNSSGTYAASKTYSSSPKWWEFEIKETAKAWRNNTLNSSYGIILINSNESSSTYYRNFLATEYTNSSYYPYITMDYTPSIVVTPSTMTLYVGQSATDALTATTCPSGISYTWFSMDPQIATVSSTGIVTAVSPGTAYIVANGGSNGSGTCVVTVVDFPTVLNFVVWDAFGLIYINGVRSSLDYNDPQYTFYTDCICNWSVDDDNIVGLDDELFHYCKIYINDGAEGEATLSCTISGTSTTSTCTINVIRITSNDVHVQLLKSNNAPFGPNETVTINNDTSPHSYNFNARIYATKNGNTYYLNYNEFVSFNISDCYDENEYISQDLYDYIQINPNTGVISVPSQENDISGYAHPTGVAALCAKCSLPGFDNSCDTKYVTVVCNDFGYNVTDDQVPRKKARYILVNHELESSNGSFYNYRSSGAFEDIFDTGDEVEYRDNDFYEDDGEILRRYMDTPNSINTFHQKLFSLIRNSEYCTIFTHGSSTGLLMSANDNTVIFDVNMINDLHKGYFNPTTLVFLKACSTNAYAPGTTPNGAPQINLANALLNKGVGIVVAFTDEVFIDDATFFEAAFYARLNGSDDIETAFDLAISDVQSQHSINMNGLVTLLTEPNG